MRVPEGVKDSFFPPMLYKISSLEHLSEEVFGPVLHVMSYKASERTKIIEEINALGYGLTFGIHSRIQETIQSVSRLSRAGNVYTNRSTIGAVVGVQPFGGRGLSGTGPKAGGPYYLHAFTTEKTVTTNTTASGGNTQLISLEE